MKLKNKLLPLTGIAVATATITPFIASCGSNKGYTGSWEWNIKEGFHIATTPRESQEFTIKETDDSGENAIVNQYAEDIKNDYNVFYDDFASTKISSATLSTWIYESDFIPTNISIQINDVKVTSIEDGEVDDNEDIMLLSFDSHLEGFVYSYDEGYVNELYQYTMCDFSIVNVPYILNYDVLMSNGMIAFVIPQDPVYWTASDEGYHATIKITQSGMTFEKYLDQESTDLVIPFPIAHPGDRLMQITANGYLQTMFDLYCEDEFIGSYHYSLAQVKTGE